MSRIEWKQKHSVLKLYDTIKGKFTVLRAYIKRPGRSHTNYLHGGLEKIRMNNTKSVAGGRDKNHDWNKRNRCEKIPQRINEFKFVEKIKRIDKHLDR